MDWAARTGKRIALALLAIAAIALAFAGEAPAAKKKCKKAKADAAAAKVCKKKKPSVGGGTPAPQPIAGPAPNVPPPPPPPVLRAEAEWAENADVDLHIWDANGNHASTKIPNGIPGVSFSPDALGTASGGAEQVYAQPNEKLVVAICHTASQKPPSVYLDTGAVVKVTVYDPSGFARGAADFAVAPGPSQSSYTYTTPDPSIPGLPPPATGWCPPLRGSLTWDTAADVDLHVFDSTGNHASPALPNGIPNAFLSADDTDGIGPERFYDLDFASSRAFYFYSCVKATNGVTGFDEYHLNLIHPPDGMIGSTTNLFQGSTSQGDHGFLYSSPSNATYPPPFTLPNYCP